MSGDKIRVYILEAVRGFLGDPPDSDYQRGYLAALIAVYTESEDDVAIPLEITEAEDLLVSTGH